MLEVGRRKKTPSCSHLASDKSHFVLDASVYMCTFKTPTVYLVDPMAVNARMTIGEEEKSQSFYTHRVAYRYGRYQQARPCGLVLDLGGTSLS